MPTERDARAARVGPLLATGAATLRLRGLELAWGRRTYVMAIVNITPDSFSGDGLLASGPGAADAAADAAVRAIAAGADLVDVGGESTRPGARAVSDEEEIARVVPAIVAIRAQTDAPISIDTSKAAVAEAALDAGADLVNDVWGLRADRRLAALIAERGVPVVLMHNRSAAGNVALRAGLGAHYAGVAFDDLLGDVRRELLASVDIALAAGIPDTRIIIDPGIGFGKTPEQNLELLDRVDAIRALGYPVLVGTSRKSFIGLTLDLPPDDRLEGTAATIAVAIARGADIVRVHDVASMVRTARMADAIVRRSHDAPEGHVASDGRA